MSKTSEIHAQQDLLWETDSSLIAFVILVPLTYPCYTMLNQHITGLAHMLNSAHQKNSTCVLCQNWRQWFSTLFSVKIALFFLLWSIQSDYLENIFIGESVQVHFILRKAIHCKYSSFSCEEGATNRQSDNWGCVRYFNLMISNHKHPIWRPWEYIYRGVSASACFILRKAIHCKYSSFSCDEGATNRQSDNWGCVRYFNLMISNHKHPIWRPWEYIYRGVSASACFILRKAIHCKYSSFSCEEGATNRQSDNWGCVRYFNLMISNHKHPIWRPWEYIYRGVSASALHLKESNSL